MVWIIDFFIGFIHVIFRFGVKQHYRILTASGNRGGNANPGVFWLLLEHWELSSLLISLDMFQLLAGTGTEM